MDLRNPFTLLRDLSKKPATIPASVLDIPTLSDQEKELIRRVGITTTQLNRDMQADVQVQWDRQRLYLEINRALDHWLVGAAVRLYASYATVPSPIANASVWITSENTKYYKILSKLLDDIGMEEKVFDWAWTCAAYGDLFVKIDGRPTLGVVSINDDRHPVQVNRVDHEGILIGFTESQVTTQQPHKMLAPWEFVHLRLLGAKRKRPVFSDPLYSEFRTMNLMSGTGTRQVSSKYGASLLLDALPTYKRLRLAEDSLLLARMTRGITRYIWKLAINHCLAGDTKISLLEGTTPTIQEMAENPYKYIGKSTWSINEATGKLEVNRIKNVKKTRKNTQLVRVHLDNGEHIDSTPDHRFMLRDGEYKEAQHLQPDESLMPHYTRKSTKYLVGYNQVYAPGDNGWHYEHRKVPGKLKRGFIVHHKDFNKLNNDPTNLVEMKRGAHSSYHYAHARKYGFSYSMLGLVKSEEWQNNIVEARRSKGGPWHSQETKDKIAKAHRGPREIRMCYSPNCLNKFECLVNSKQRYCSKSCSGYDLKKTKAFITAECAHGCGEQFAQIIYGGREKRFIYGHSNYGVHNPNYDKHNPAWNKGLTKETDPRVAQYGVSGSKTKREKRQKKESLLNHKVVSVEWLTEKQDTYDIEMEGSPNFPLASGVFVHNSNMEAVNEIVDQIGMTLKRARALNTSASDPGYDSKESPMGVSEDIFMPVWGDNTNNLTFDEIGGKPDIRWIVDIDGLRNQLACTLRTPLQLLGGYVDEATGALGSEAIEKLDIGFARNARRIQRALKEGIKRICQIHLAYMNMDPDPALFEVNMSETSTAEEEVIVRTFETGVEIIDRVIDLVEKVDPEADKKEIFNYMNKKILKLEGFDLDTFKKTSDVVVRRNEGKIVVPDYVRYPISNKDLVSYLPLSSTSINEGGKVRTIEPSLSERSLMLFAKRWKGNWKSRYENLTVVETKGNEKPIVPASVKKLREQKAKADALVDPATEI